jgi:polyvinyl alcohol dehydrogenase (cytochrome)
VPAVTQIARRARSLSLPVAASAAVALALCALVLGGVAPARAAAPTRTQLLGDQHANTTTVIGSRTVAGMKKAWFVATPALVSSTPLVWGGGVFFSDWSGQVWRVSSTTGKVVWKQQLGTPQLSWAWHGLAGTGVIAGSTLVEASVEGDAWGLNETTGKVLWHTSLAPTDQYAGNLSDLLYDGTRVYVGMSSIDEPMASVIPGFPMASNGSVIALDPRNGALAWQTYITTAPDTGGAVWSSFAVDSSLGLVFCDTGNNYTQPPTSLTDAVLALRTATGAVAWAQQEATSDVTPGGPGPDDDFGAGPQLFSARSGGKTLRLVGAMQKQGIYWAFDRSTGTPVWHAQVGTPNAMESRGEASVGAGRVFAWAETRSATATFSRTSVVALDAASGRARWSRPAAQAAATTTAGFLAADVYLLGDDTGHVVAYRASDGKKLWTGRTRRGLGVLSSLWAQGRYLYAGVGFGGQTGLQAFRVP